MGSISIRRHLQLKNFFSKQKAFPFKSVKTISLENIVSKECVVTAARGRHLFMMDVLEKKLHHLDARSELIETNEAEPIPFTTADGQPIPERAYIWLHSVLVEICINQNFHVFIDRPPYEKTEDLFNTLVGRRVYLDSKNQKCVTTIYMKGKRDFRYMPYMLKPGEYFLKFYKYDKNGEVVFESLHYELEMEIHAGDGMVIHLKSFSVCTDKNDNVYVAFLHAPYVILKFNSEGRF